MTENGVVPEEGVPTLALTVISHPTDPLNTSKGVFVCVCVGVGGCVCVWLWVWVWVWV